MAINFCTIDSSTINTFCGNRRQVIIDQLLPPRPVRGGAAQGWTPGRPIRTWRDTKWEPPVMPAESAVVTITAEFMGIKGVDTQTLTSRPDLITITDLQID